jgi:hypothetical protein
MTKSIMVGVVLLAIWGQEGNAMDPYTELPNITFNSKVNKIS